MILMSILFTTCVKVLLIPSYHSTDFEVHRNWLAITHQLPLNKWYFENTSEWTLDYPPLFAWFEWILSFIAKLFDPNMLLLDNVNYASEATVLFQRLSVILTDLLYAYGTYKCSIVLPKGWKTEVVLTLLLITNVGLLMLDHVHFQYNGFLYGILLLSIANMIQENYLFSAFWFSILINLKHIYIYMGPTYFVYLLRNYCFEKSQSGNNFKDFLCSFSFYNTAKLGAVVVSVFLATYLPFSDHLGQVLSRLFPFKRGLCHAYWAPNIWAIYNTLDKISLFVGKRIGVNVTAPAASMTGGLVQEFSHTMLPNITPFVTLLLTALAMLPGCIKLWSVGKSYKHFIRSLVLCSLTSFLFGWHVHEKAILMAVIPLSILAIIELEDAKLFLLLSCIGHYSLFPLLFPKSLVTIKALLYVIYTVYSFYSLSNLFPKNIKYSLPLLNFYKSFYLFGLIPLFFYDNFVHNFLGLSKTLPFLPLMATSLYCSLGVVYCWIKLLRLFCCNYKVQKKIK